MSLRLGDIAPNFKAQTTEGAIDFYEFLGDSWGILFSHPADFTPVCTTELGKTALLQEEFQISLFSATNLAPGAHTLKIEVTGLKNPASSGIQIVVDAFDVY